ncbi:hypothetical protein P43SY_002832 [Pythium insidiosum]|uniref:Glycerophosphodiesterase n=1 Tax=Pythium insidiosum TaxID=114742 RepID=A0AAD5LSG1_PYTIN|nr:hypothetical protein P43SY_002832 [Pythium insidiosum]
MQLELSVRVFPRHLTALGVENARVCVLGSISALGAWNTRLAVPLRRVDALTWAVAIDCPDEASARTLEYKYVIQDAATLDVLAWECIPGNRTLSLTTARNLARNKPARQSSTYEALTPPVPGARAPSNGNNGDCNGFQEWRCARTTRERHAWWMVDLEQSVAIDRAHLWKARTYHEEPQRPDAQPPVAHTRDERWPSGQPAAPLWLFVSTDERLATIEGSTLLAQAKARSLPSTISAFQVTTEFADRVAVVGLQGVVGRFLRLQQDSETARALQFAELEVFGVQGDAEAKTVRALDSVFGVEDAVDGDLREYVDSDWVDPRGDHAMLRLWIGSFQKDQPALQWLNGPRHEPVALNVRYQTRSATSAWTANPVDQRSASLLDKESERLRAHLKTVQHQQAQRQYPLTEFTNGSGVTSLDDWLHRLLATQLVSSAQVDELRRAAESVSFPAGATLLGVGERRRVAFFITSGQVDVCGPPSTCGSPFVWGCLSNGAAFNDWSLFSKWPERAAAFHAASAVDATTLSFETLRRVLGVETLGRLRRHWLTQLDAVASSKTEMKPLVLDQDHAHTVRMKLPAQAIADDSTAGADHRVVLEIVSSAGQDSAVLAAAFLLPSQLSSHGEGFLTLPVLATSRESPVPEVVAQLSLHYLVVKPFQHEHNGVAAAWRSYWRERLPLNGGHRGMGRCFHQVGGFRKALTRENTLASFVLAGRSGADFVEFDVQLSKDRVPVLYHDFVLQVGLEDRSAWSAGTRAEPVTVGIHDVTLRQLATAHTAAVPRKPEPTLRRLIKKHWLAILGRRTSIGAPTVPPSVLSLAAVDDEHLVEFYPRLESLLRHVPPSIGLNIEIKYPDPIKRMATRMSPAFAMNEYVDAILRCVFDHAGERRIFFSCFDPTLVVLLRAKQATYPVFFLTYGRVESPVVDTRLTMQFAIELVKMERLRGIVSNSDDLLAAPATVELVKREGIVLMTWGDQNTGHACVQQQKHHAVDGIISDNVGDLTRQEQRAMASA